MVQRQELRTLGKFYFGVLSNRVALRVSHERFRLTRALTCLAPSLLSIPPSIDTNPSYSRLSLPGVDGLHPALCVHTR